MSSVHAKYMHYEKFYIEITVVFTKDGAMIPESFEWFGQTVTIDKVLDRKKVPPEYVGAYLTDVFICKIRGKVRKLYFEREENRWFVEAQCNDEK